MRFKSEFSVFFLQGDNAMKTSGECRWKKKMKKIIVLLAKISAFLVSGFIVFSQIYLKNIQQQTMSFKDQPTTSTRWVIFPNPSVLQYRFKRNELVTNFVKLRIYEFECWYLHSQLELVLYSQYIKINKQTQYHEIFP